MEMYVDMCKHRGSWNCGVPRRTITYLMDPWGTTLPKFWQKGPLRQLNCQKGPPTKRIVKKDHLTSLAVTAGGGRPCRHRPRRHAGVYSCMHAFASCIWTVHSFEFFETSQKIRKKYLDIANCMQYDCAKIHCKIPHILGSEQRQIQQIFIANSETCTVYRSGHCSLIRNKPAWGACRHKTDGLFWQFV